MSKELGKKKTLTQLEKEVFGPKRPKVHTMKRKGIKDNLMFADKLGKQKPKSRT